MSERRLKYATAIQKGKGPIIPLTAANLIGLIGAPSNEVQRLIDRHDLAKALEKFNKE